MTNENRSAIDQNFEAIRRVMETRTFEELDTLLAEQRALIGQLSFADSESRACFNEAQSLTAWSLNMLKLQRSGLEETLSNIGKLKQLEKYQQASLTPQAL